MLRIGILISGSGTTAVSIIEAVRKGILKAQIQVVISSRADKSGVEKTKKLNLPTVVIDPRAFSSKADFADKLLTTLKRFKVNFVSQNGWIPLTPPQVVVYFQGRIINQHPGPLDPGVGDDFGGKGMYGSRVTFSRLAYLLLTGEEPWTESSTHYVATAYDQGDLLGVVKLKLNKFNFKPTLIDLLRKNSLQRFLIVETQEVQKKLLPIEHQNVINTLKVFAGSVADKNYISNVKGFRRTKRLVPARCVPLLSEVKKLSIKLYPHG